MGFFKEALDGRLEIKAGKVECATEMCHTKINDGGSGRCRRCQWLESQGVNLLGNGTATFDWGNRLTRLENGEAVYLDGSYFHDGVGRELTLPEHLRPRGSRESKTTPAPIHCEGCQKEIENPHEEPAIQFDDSRWTCGPECLRKIQEAAEQARAEWGMD